MGGCSNIGASRSLQLTQQKESSEHSSDISDVQYLPAKNGELANEG
jgi:hypothetical protein